MPKDAVDYDALAEATHAEWIAEEAREAAVARAFAEGWNAAIRAMEAGEDLDYREVKG